MKYSLEWLKSKLEKKEKIEFLFFWGNNPSLDGNLTTSCLSQWWPSNFQIEEITFKTAEHFMMAEKAKLFGDMESYDKILACDKPGDAKKLGRQVKKFNNSQWTHYRYDAVLKGSMNKFTQQKDLKEFLLNTGDLILVEASPIDKIWGIGLREDDLNARNPHKWLGLNLLGFALMETRDFLMNSKDE